MRDVTNINLRILWIQKANLSAASCCNKQFIHKVSPIDFARSLWHPTSSPSEPLMENNDEHV